MSAEVLPFQKTTPRKPPKAKRAAKQKTVRVPVWDYTSPKGAPVLRYDVDYASLLRAFHLMEQLWLRAATDQHARRLAMVLLKVLEP